MKYNEPISSSSSTRTWAKPFFCFCTINKRFTKFATFCKIPSYNIFSSRDNREREKKTGFTLINLKENRESTESSDSGCLISDKYNKVGLWRGFCLCLQVFNFKPAAPFLGTEGKLLAATLDLTQSWDNSRQPAQDQPSGKWKKEDEWRGQ